MKLSKIAILAIKGMGREGKEKIAQAAGVEPVTVYGWIQRNEPDSDLTKASVLQLIREETGLTDDQILTEDEDVKEVA